MKAKWWLSLVTIVGVVAQYLSCRVPGEYDTEASGINDAGQIVGWYMDAKGFSHGFLATPVP